ncbi:type II toxin-antitoxin system BrnA family antitoxin [Marinospirillum minutulum]|uniref:type II toxin-antitoxin system BrnA family antitoxin n=1 Tax=Marinospirillum minutulum TaxID=64974 RepID=UPI0004190A22|nr:CopG family antitoxin [Marinospirillum minutulum]
MKTIKAEELDKMFDDGQDISAYIDTSKGKRVNIEQKKVDLDLPIWMIKQLDLEAKKLGVARQAIMKMFLAQHLEP